MRAKRSGPLYCLPAFAVALWACSGGPGGYDGVHFFDSVEGYYEHPLPGREAPGSYGENPARANEAPPIANESPSERTRTPAPQGTATEDGKDRKPSGNTPTETGNAGNCLTCGTYRCGDSSLTLVSASGGGCSTAGGSQSLTFTCDGKITSGGQSVGTWTKSGSTVNVVVGNTTASCTEGGATTNTDPPPTDGE